MIPKLEKTRSMAAELVGSDMSFLAMLLNSLLTAPDLSTHIHHTVDFVLIANSLCSTLGTGRVSVMKLISSGTVSGFVAWSSSCAWVTWSGLSFLPL